MLIQLRMDTEEFKQMIGELGGNTTLLSDLIDSL